MTVNIVRTNPQQQQTNQKPDTHDILQSKAPSKRLESRHSEKNFFKRVIINAILISNRENLMKIFE